MFAKRTQVDSIYTVFSKAFDKVNHSILIKKLEGYGIHGNLLRWISSYLHNRSQLINIKWHLSAPVTISSGVPQGSHLGPLLFIVFINDLVQQLSCPCLLYADDLKIYSSITKTEDCVILQNNLKAIVDWCAAKTCF